MKVRHLLQLETALALAVGTLVLQLSWPGIIRWSERPQPGKQVERSVGRPNRCMERCLVYLPPDYREDKKWPLVIYLHGAGARGEDALRVRGEGLPRMLDEGADFSFIVIAPVCRPDRHWQSDAVVGLLDEVCGEFPIDERRIYLAGFSMGAFGVWETAKAIPNRVAALLPIAGGGEPEGLGAFRGLPIWAFHGDVDEVVPISSTRKMVEAAAAAGADAELTVLKGRGHGVCNFVFSQAGAIKWLTMQRKPER